MPSTGLPDRILNIFRSRFVFVALYPAVDRAANNDAPYAGRW